MFGVPINEATVGGALLLSMTFLSLTAVVVATAAIWCAARTLRRRCRARRVLDTAAMHINTCVAMNPDLRTGFDRLEAAIREQDGRQA